MICCGQPYTTDKLRKLDCDYLMNEHARAMCRMGHTFRKLVDDDMPTNNDRLMVDFDVRVDSNVEDSEVGYLSPDVEKEDY